jgi:hypothetical protein
VAPASPDGFGQEETIRQIWQKDNRALNEFTREK